MSALNPIVVDAEVAVSNVVVEAEVETHYDLPVELETLTATENTTYNAPAGTAWDKVDVAVPGIEVEPLTVTENGTYTPLSGKAFGPVAVNVPNPSSGSISINANGTYDVTEKAEAVVDVPLSFLGRNVNLHLYEVTVGDNNVSNAQEFVNYLFSLTGYSGTFNVNNLIIGLLDEIALADNMIVGTGFYDSGLLSQGSVWRYRSGAINRVLINTAYDAIAIKGTHYFVCWADGSV